MTVTLSVAKKAVGNVEGLIARATLPTAVKMIVVVASITNSLSCSCTLMVTGQVPPRPSSPVQSTETSAVAVCGLPLYQ